MTLKITPELNSVFSELIQCNEQYEMSITFENPLDVDDWKMCNFQGGKPTLRVGDMVYDIITYQENSDTFNLCKKNSQKDSTELISEIGSIYSKLIVKQTLSVAKKKEISSKTKEAQKELRARKAIRLNSEPIKARKNAWTVGDVQSIAEVPKKPIANTLLGRKRQMPSPYQTIGLKKTNQSHLNMAGASKDVKTDLVEVIFFEVLELDWVTRSHVDELFSECGKVLEAFFCPWNLVCTQPKHLRLCVRFSSHYEAERSLVLAEEGFTLKNTAEKRQV